MKKEIMKLGEIRDTNKGTKMWGYEIKQLWLCKNGETRNYMVMGLCKDEDNIAHGWCTMFEGSLKDARVYAMSH